VRPHPHKAPQVVRPHPHKTLQAVIPHLSHVVIRTVPPVPGLPVTVSGVTHLTDPTGTVVFESPTTSVQLSDRITLSEVSLPIAGKQVEVTPIRLYRFPSGAQIALDLSYPVHFSFANLTGLSGQPIRTLTVRSMTGQTLDLAADRGSWLEGARAVPKDTGLDVKTVDWSVQRVTYGGSNVVNESQQRFSPSKQSDVVVTLLFYSFKLHVRDALFGFSRTGTVELAYPNGRAQRYVLDRGGRMSLPVVPRGDYVVTVVGAGPHLPQALTVSRDQDVELSFFSWLDIGTVTGVVLALAVLLALIGRVRRRPGRVVHRHRRRSAWGRTPDGTGLIQAEPVAAVHAAAPDTSLGAMSEGASA
jgi:hypothetical protein